jgi:hypothetical protein
MPYSEAKLNSSGDEALLVPEHSEENAEQYLLPIV